LQSLPREDLVIKPADKGRAVVIMDTDLHGKEALRQLSNEQYYGPLTFHFINLLQVIYTKFWNTRQK